MMMKWSPSYSGWATISTTLLEKSSRTNSLPLHTIRLTMRWSMNSFSKLSSSFLDLTTRADLSAL